MLAITAAANAARTAAPRGRCPLGALRALAAFSRDEEAQRATTRIVAVPKKQPTRSVWLTTQRLRDGGEFWASKRSVLECVSDAGREMSADVQLEAAVPTCLLDIGAQIGVRDVAQQHVSCRYDGADRSMSVLDTQLFDAVVDADADAVRQLCREVSPRIHHGVHGGTPLHLAAWHGHRHIVQLLLQLGCDVNAGAANGSTALHWASGAGHNGVVAVLLEAGADPMPYNGQTPVHWAAESGHDSVLQLLSRWAPLSVVIPDEMGSLPSKMAYDAGKWSSYDLLTCLESEDYFPVRVSLEHELAADHQGNQNPPTEVTSVVE